MHNLVVGLLALPLIALPVAAKAESPWSVKVGFSQVNPKSNNGLLAGSLSSEVSSEVGFTPSIEYKFTDNIVAEVLLAIPFKHDVTVTGGALTNSVVASFKHLPPTVSAKYLFSPGAAFSPYVGVGLNYTFVFSEKTKGALAGTELKGNNSVGLAASAGFEYRIPNSPWGIGVDLRYINIKSDLKLDGNDIGELSVDPTVIGISAVYNF
jgi:outer membrane protein